MTKINQALFIILAFAVVLLLCFGLFAPTFTASAVADNNQTWQYAIVSGDNPFVVTSEIKVSPYQMTTIVRNNEYQNLDGF